MSLRRFLNNEITYGICAGLIVGAAAFALATTGPTTIRAVEPVGVTRAVAPAAVTRVALEVTPTLDMSALEKENPSADVRYVAEWISRSADPAGLPFVIVDKKDARIYVFDRLGQLRGASPVLLGSAIGDDSVPDIGLRPVSEVLPEERTTPAGRFIAHRGENARGEDVVWVDYDAAVSMHRVLTTHAEEERLARLATDTPDDNRISAGCINVPVEFFEVYLRPVFARDRGVVYVLPEVKPIEAVFPSRGGVLARSSTQRPQNASGNGALMLLLLALRTTGKS